ncbi:MAG: hypothetical protein O2V44_01620 [Candidatus Bathyarchaeota archaeon]|jgi:hypothetical protein|nr:hypothetical protein [Candidatus Bathyarchaeota archaeon]
MNLPEESVVVVCPNPKCRREIEEPIILAILSVTPPKEYEACPYCFANLEPEPTIEQKDVPEPTIDHEEVMEEEATPTIKSVNSVLEKAKDSSPWFLKKVKALIPSSNWSQKEKREKTEEPQAEPAGKKEEKATKEEPKTEPFVKEEPKEESKTEPSVEKESGSSGCPQSFGYLANRPKDTPIPQECLVCPKMVDCMLSPRESETS